MSRYEFWYADPLGNRISNIFTVSKFSYVKVAGDVGILQLATPLQGLEHEAKIPDRRIHVYRQAYGGSLILEMVAFLDVFSYSTSQDGLDQFDIGGSGLNDLLRRRIVAYAAGDAKSTYSGSFSSNQFREAVRVNLQNGAVATRDLSTYLDLANNISQGAAIEKQAAWRNTLAVLQDIQAFSKQAGTEVFFGIVPTSETTMQFRTYANQLGADRTVSTGSSPVVFSLERGNLLNPQLTYNYANEANYIYAGGQGSESDRIIQEAENTASTGQSPFARKEAFLNATNHETADSVLDAAQDKLEKSRPKINLTGILISTPTSEYGLHWFHGDKVTIDYQNIQIDTIIRAISVSVDGDGRETIQARIESDV